MSASITIPTGSDISIEVNGRRLAVAQSYKLRAQRSAQYIEAFGSATPVGTVEGKTQYALELTRVCACGAALSDGVDFYALLDFNVVIARPGRKVIFSGCQWSDIRESAAAGDLLFETVTVAASRRQEVSE